jgi:Flp pilus assembly protein TadD
MPSAIAAPEEIRTRYVTGLTQLRAGRAEAAIESLRQVLILDPSHASARRNLIRALSTVHEHTAIIDETGRALRDAPDSAELHFLSGTAFNALSRPTEACESLTVAVRLNPSFAPGWLNLGNALMDLGYPEAAEAHCRQALALDPVLTEALISLGFMLTAAGRLTEAVRVLEEAISAHPDNVHAHWNLATAVLLAGDLRRGFAEYEWRKRHDRFRLDFVNARGAVWDGGDPRGRTILIQAEQGIGDTVQFARYLPAIAERGGKPVLVCTPSLVPFLKTLPGVEVISKCDPLPRYDVWIDQMSLPHVFGTTLDTIPSPSGYLSADPALIAARRASLPPTMRIGLVWGGNPMHRNDHQRTPPAEVFAPLLALPDRHVISLIPDRALPGMVCPARPLTNYAETAALISALDLIVTVDTSVAHVAGALGRPAWVLLPFAPDWRWLLNRNDTPWYDSLRLFRQPAPGDWRSVISSVVAALAA